MANDKRGFHWIRTEIERLDPEVDSEQIVRLTSCQLLPKSLLAVHLFYTVGFVRFASLGGIGGPERHRDALRPRNPARRRSHVPPLPLGRRRRIQPHQRRKPRLRTELALRRCPQLADARAYLPAQRRRLHPHLRPPAATGRRSSRTDRERAPRPADPLARRVRTPRCDRYPGYLAGHGTVPRILRIRCFAVFAKRHLLPDPRAVFRLSDIIAEHKYSALVTPSIPASGTTRSER